VEIADVGAFKIELNSQDLRRRRMLAQEEAYMLSCYRGTGCAPKASSATKSAAAVAKAENEKAHQSAMEIIAKEMREAYLSKMEAEKALEYATSVVEYNRNRIRRLEERLKDLHE
jgi:ribosome biogenesis protein Tsr3